MTEKVTKQRFIASYSKDNTLHEVGGGRGYRETDRERERDRETERDRVRERERDT